MMMTEDEVKPLDLFTEVSNLINCTGTFSPERQVRFWKIYFKAISKVAQTQINIANSEPNAAESSLSV